MYLLYVDDSGVTSDPNVKYSVLAGFATFENQTYWIQKAVDWYYARHYTATKNSLLPFHLH